MVPQFSDASDSPELDGYDYGAADFDDEDRPQMEPGDSCGIVPEPGYDGGYDIEGEPPGEGEHYAAPKN